MYLQSTYKPANLEGFAQNKCNNLTLQQKGKVVGVLNKHDKLFQGKRGECTGNTVTLTLTKDAKPFRCSPYLILLKQRNELEKEAYRQYRIGALGQLSAEEMEILQRKEHYLSAIDELISGVGGFVFASVVDLIMGYLSIPLDEAARKLLTIVFPFG